MSNSAYILTDLLNAYQNGHATRTALYIDVAERLSQIAGKSPPWKPDYVQAIAAGTLAASKKMAHAIQVLAAEVDGTPADISNTEPVVVYARPGTVQPNALVLKESVVCAYPPCTVHFIPSHPRMIYCPLHRDPKSRPPAAGESRY